MNFVELSVIVSPRLQGEDILITELANLGYDSFAETEDGFNAYIEESDFSNEGIQKLFDHYLKEFSIKHTTQLIEQKNWNEEWERSFSPIIVGNECTVRAPFHDVNTKCKYNIIIEPKMSFGTGHHQTTRLMISQLLKLNVKSQQVLDMGCGTGVLAILSAKMGAKQVLAVDIDEWSYNNCIENCKSNNVDIVEVKLGGVEQIKGSGFFTILANINKNILLKQIPLYFSVLHEGGDLLLSGFFDSDTDEIIEKANQTGLMFVDKKIEENWALLHFQKH